MIERDTGGLAFPCGTSEQTEEIGPGTSARRKINKPMHVGMTLRDYFAAQCFAVASGLNKYGCADGHLGVARNAYAMADAMLKARQS